MNRRGYRTTEFWVTIAVSLAGVWAALTGTDVAPEAEETVRSVGLLVAGVAAAFYNLARGLAKRGTAPDPRDVPSPR